MIAEGSFINSDDSLDVPAWEGALLLLFASGQRPDAHAVRAAVSAAGRLTIVHEMRDGAGGEARGFELLRDGMTYDLTGLAPSPAPRVPAPRRRYGIEGPVDLDSFEALALRPGPHLAAGGHLLPVMRTMAGIAAGLVPGLPGLCAVAWPPADTLVGPGLFASSVGAWVAGGAFPALVLTALADAPDGALVSVGLAWFTGQELRIAPQLAKDRAAAARLGVRLVNQLVLQGKVIGHEDILAPDGGHLALEPTRDGKVVRVRRG